MKINILLFIINLYIQIIIMIPCLYCLNHLWLKMAHSFSFDFLFSLPSRIHQTHRHQTWWFQVCFEFEYLFHVCFHFDQRNLFPKFLQNYLIKVFERYFFLPHLHFNPLWLMTKVNFDSSLISLPFSFKSFVSVLLNFLKYEFLFLIS